MKNTIHAALIVALLSTAATVAVTPVLAQTPAPAAAAAPLRVGAEVGKKLNGANDKITANDLDGAMVLAKEALAIPKLTPAEEFQIHKMIGIIAIKKDDYATAEDAFDFLVRSPVLPAAEKAQDLQAVAGIAATNKHYDKVMEYATMGEAAGINEPGLFEAAAQSAFAKDDFKTAEAQVQKAIAASKAKGATPSRNTLSFLAQVQSTQKKDAEAEVTLQQIAFTYGTGDDWGFAISQAIGTPGVNDNTVMYLARLADASEATVVKADANAFAEAANHAGSYGDLLKAREHGATNVPAPAAAKVAADKAAVAKAEGEADKAKDGMLAMGNAQAYYGYGDFAKAETFARMAMAKGGLKNPFEANDAPMVLGQALVAQGHYSDAIPIFTGIKSTNAAMTKAAYLWAGYAQLKLKQVSAPPAAAR